MSAFRRIDGAGALPPDLKGGIIAIGNFDGVHRGHVEVLSQVLAMARAKGVPAIVLTFEPHPRKHFQPDAPHFVLTPAHLRAELLEALGFDAVVEHPFDADCAGLTAEQFISDILVDQLRASHVVVGFDFHFGKGRKGNPKLLAEAGEQLGFGVTCIEAFDDEGGQVISSSRIRARLEEGDVEHAAGLLGYRFAVEAPVIKGQQLGRTLGFPTANMELPKDTRLREGIYAVRLRRADGSLYDGVASFGRRPTVTNDGAPLLETYVFDFSGDLYGETCRVSFFAFLRPELKFDGLEALTAQIRQDEAEARAALSGVRPLSELDARLNFALDN